MSVYKGTELLAGVATNTVSNAHSLFDFIWSDHIKNELSWLRAGTFSWQNGNLYVGAYNHLLADYSGGTSQTETVGSYTITYVLADDGHKITTDETTVANIYAESGVAWYYILDTVNTRFKLPRINPAREELIQTVRAKGNGKTVTFTDGTDSGGTAIRNMPNLSGSAGVLLHKDSINADIGTSISDDRTWGTAQKTVGITTDSTKSGIISSMTDSTSVYKGKKYLYFYVGNFSQSATEQTAGLNASLFNGKADIDLSNAASNASASAKETIVGWGMPDYSTEITTGLPTYPTSSTTQTYTCPVNGWILMFAERASSGYTLQFFVGNTIKMRFPANTASFADIMYPVSKGDVIKINTDSASTTWTIHWCNFISCKGA